jgi:hypothetical protein
MVLTNKLDSIRGGVSYGSSHALVPLHIADIIAGSFRRFLEGHTYHQNLVNRLRVLHYADPPCPIGRDFLSIASSRFSRTYGRSVYDFEILQFWLTPITDRDTILRLDPSYA